MNVRLTLLLALIGIAALSPQRISSALGVIRPAGYSTATGAPSLPLDIIQAANPSDVMNGATAETPAFPKLAKKPGYLRGWVRDSKGRPLTGASILLYPPALFVGGVRSCASAVAKSDENGMYELRIPSPGCVVWCAGYSLEYHGVYMALTLRPAEGELGPLNEKTGEITNFVLAPYGVVDPAQVDANPEFGGGYYGAAFTIGYNIRGAGDIASPPEWLTAGSEVEITLTPDGPLVDGSAGRPIAIRQTLTSRGYFPVNDIPVGRYQIRAALIENGGKSPLRIRDNSGIVRKGGLTPPETTDTATVLFRSATADPAIPRVTTGNIERLSLLIERAK